MPVASTPFVAGREVDISCHLNVILSVHRSVGTVWVWIITQIHSPKGINSYTCFPQFCSPHMMKATGPNASDLSLSEHRGTRQAPRHAVVDEGVALIARRPDPSDVPPFLSDPVPPTQRPCRE
ncbi:hypothetical protein AAFF_G00038690 [Aldrovandia affinis]|uniref:Uncharacterized protein n=1 Tax=Aldrovandia affinis TaxID=143900 RepID=A0AAD7T6D2_9TELE|nr:hypothetical protein AAFF_G00038690 [Aldrovandia affinis]